MIYTSSVHFKCMLPTKHFLRSLYSYSLMGSFEWFFHAFMLKLQFTLAHCMNVFHQIKCNCNGFLLLHQGYIVWFTINYSSCNHSLKNCCKCTRKISMYYNIMVYFSLERQHNVTFHHLGYFQTSLVITF